MAASLLTRCAAHSTRSFLTKVSRRACLLCTKPTDGQKDTVHHQKNQTVEKGSESSAGERALAGFAKALEKAKIVPEDDVADDLQTTETEHTTFAAMLRHSKLVQLGDVTGRMVMGTVVEVVGDDLYIDLGGKFHCVCSRPKLNSDRYYRGVKVKLRLNDLEMSASFLGSEKHVTLLEADATLIGLRRQPSSLSSWYGVYRHHVTLTMS